MEQIFYIRYNNLTSEEWKKKTILFYSILEKKYIVLSQQQ